MKSSKDRRLDQLFDWFVKTEQSEELRKQALESVGLEYKLRETSDDVRRKSERARKEDECLGGGDQDV